MQWVIKDTDERKTLITSGLRDIIHFSRIVEMNENMRVIDSRQSFSNKFMAHLWNVQNYSKRSAMNQRAWLKSSPKIGLIVNGRDGRHQLKSLNVRIKCFSIMIETGSLTNLILGSVEVVFGAREFVWLSCVGWVDGSNTGLEVITRWNLGNW
jgi:hypothetical protein